MLRLTCFEIVPESRALQQAGALPQEGMNAEAVANEIGVLPRTGHRLQRRARELGQIRGVREVEWQG